MIEKAAASGADEVFLDLEDACAPAEKASARALAVELLTTLAVAAISLALVVPSFDSVVSNNRRATAINQLVSTMHAARGEAINRFGPSNPSFGTSEVNSRVAVSPSHHDFAPSTLPGDNQRVFDSSPGDSFASLEPRTRDDAPSSDLHSAEPSELLLAMWKRISGPTLFDQTKTVLAIIGTLSVVIVFLRFGSNREKERYHEEEAE